MCPAEGSVRGTVAGGVGGKWLAPGGLDMDEPSASASGEESGQREELRTIAFRLREIQRLLADRVEQENRRLEAEGFDTVESRSPGTDEGR